MSIVQSLLTVHNLSKTFDGVRAVDALSFVWKRERSLLS